MCSSLICSRLPEALRQAKQSLTINGVHLSDEGYKALAPVIFRELLGETAPDMNIRAIEKLRQADQRQEH